MVEPVETSRGSFRPMSQKWYKAVVIETTGWLVDIQHVVLLLLSAFVGAVVSYLSSQPTTTLVQALQSWSTAWPMLKSALVVGAVAALALLKNSALKPTPTLPSGPFGGRAGGRCAPDLYDDNTPHIFDPPPAETHNERSAHPARKLPWGPIAFAACVAMGFVVPAAVSGCIPALQAITTHVEEVVLDDLLNHVPYPQIEQDVAKAIAGQVGADVIIVLQDTINFLIDIGVVPASVRPYAEQVRTIAAGKHAAGQTYMIGRQP